MLEKGTYRLTRQGMETDYGGCYVGTNRETGETDKPFPNALRHSLTLLYRAAPSPGTWLTQIILAMIILSSCSQETPLAEMKQKAEQGDAAAQFRLGLMYSTGEGVAQDSAEAVRWYRAAAEQGHTIAQNNLGAMYGAGEGVAQDSAEAVRWYRTAAEQGHALAQNNLAAAYATGEGVAQDSVEAVRRYRVAAEQGQALAQHNLGVMYATGEGVAQDYAEAIRWYRLAAEQENALAQNNLGAAYATGEGVPQDYIQAHMWYSLAAASSRGELRESVAMNRDSVAKQMTREQIAEAQRLAREWKRESRVPPHK